MKMLLVAILVMAPLLLGIRNPLCAAGGVFALDSPAFKPGQTIPARFTCVGEDRSPGLAWSGSPEETRSFAMICDDPDAPVGLWVHWVLYNIPAGVSELPEGMGKEASIPAGALEGQNSWGKGGYNGPCPPPGKPHRYFFKLYALDAPLSLLAGATKAQVEAAMKGHVLAQVELMGTFGR